MSGNTYPPQMGDPRGKAPENGACAATGSQDWLDNIYVVSGRSRLAADLAKELEVEMGSIVNPVLCRVGDAALGLEETTVLVLMASDMACDADQVSRALRRTGHPVSRLNDDEIARFSDDLGQDGLFPILLAANMPTVLDASLKRFERIYSRAGTRQCLIETSYDELKTFTGGLVSYALAPKGWFTAR